MAVRPWSSMPARLAAATLLGLAMLGAGLPATAAPLPPGAIQQAIEKARDWLLKQQKPDGTWVSAMRAGNDSVGPTALVMLSLANAGITAEDPRMQRALDWLRGQKPNETYSVALQTLALAMLAPDRDRAILERNVAWLEQAQVRQGPARGSWSYDQKRAGGSGDNSNAQFALLALHEAARAGVRVKDDTWLRAQDYWVGCANPDGSWGYTIGQGGSGSMTCAGIASVWITAEHVAAPDARAGDAAVSCCGGGGSPDVLERGIKWLGNHFSVEENPSSGKNWFYYYLYGLERVGRFTARRFIGDHDWYLKGAETLARVQNRLTGQFAAERIEDPIVATSFALLFLAKGRRPVIVAKSRQPPGSDWNQHGHDVAHLVEYVENRWRDDYPAGLSWHVLDTPAAEREDLLQAPVLWLSGRKAFDLGPDAGPRLRQYIDEGGFIFAEACCPESEAFDQRLRQLAEEIFPEREYRLHLLPPEHPAWHAEEIVPPELHRPLLGIDYGCRTCLIYAPPSKGRDAMPSLSCLWELGGPSRARLAPAIRREVDAALAIGSNVLAYATNRELKSKDQLFEIAPADDTAPKEKVRGELAIAKLRHAGLCDAAPAALANMLRTAARELGVRVDDAPRQIDPAAPELFDHHLVFMHGRQGFTWTDRQRAALATFFDRGGMLLADSVCAAAGFTQAFRAELARILPDHKLEAIPADDPIYTAAGYGGYDIREVTLREPGGGEGRMGVRKRRLAPQLEGVRMGDRWVVIFSPFDISCALEKQNSMECTGYDREDAEKIALNVLLYSLNH